MTMTETPSSATTAHPRRWQALGLLAVAQFMLILDITVVTVAMPDMGADLGLDRESADLGDERLHARLRRPDAARAAGPPTSSDRAGSCSPGSACSRSPRSSSACPRPASCVIGGPGRPGRGGSADVAGRAVVVVRLFDGDERNKALGIWSSLGGVGAAVGVLLGGVLTAGPGWEWVFFVNVPVGVALLVGLTDCSRRCPPGRRRARLDVVGAFAGDRRDRCW